MKVEASAGAVVFRDFGSSRKYLLLHYNSKNPYWGFPRGNVEVGESEEETCRREVEEETGICGLDLKDGFMKEVSWYYKRDDETFHKVVVYFLGMTDREAVSLSDEHIGYAWLSFDNALKRLTFDNSRVLLKQAEVFLEGNI